jgi:hypothetical protein
VVKANTTQLRCGTVRHSEADEKELVLIGNSTIDHIHTLKLVPIEQKDCIPKFRTTKDQLLTDKAIIKHCKRRNKNLCTAWVDFKKAYDSVPHSWIVERMRMSKLTQKSYSLAKAKIKNVTRN